MAPGSPRAWSGSSREDRHVLLIDTFLTGGSKAPETREKEIL